MSRERLLVADANGDASRWIAKKTATSWLSQRLEIPGAGSLLVRIPIIRLAASKFVA